MNTTADTRTARRRAAALFITGLVLLIAAGVIYHTRQHHWEVTQRQASADALFGLDYGLADAAAPSPLVPVLIGIAGALATTIAVAVALVLPARTAR